MQGGGGIPVPPLAGHRRVPSLSDRCLSLSFVTDAGLVSLPPPKPCVCAACDYGDPQLRPRLIIMAARNDAPMPDHPAPTHGVRRGGLQRPFVTPGDVLEYYRTPEGRACPNMNDVRRPSLEGGEVVRLHANRLAPTVMASGAAPVVHYAEDSAISVREAAELQSFPPHYEILGSSVVNRYRQVGNAVPVGLARAIARSVRDSIRYDHV